MKCKNLLKLAFILIVVVLTCTGSVRMKLPKPNLKGTVSVEEAIARRRSIRRFKKRPLTIKQISQLLWACQGITDPINKLRAAPSAGATYPFETYVVVGDVEGLEDGVYHYEPETHSITLVRSGDLRRLLAIACLRQMFIEEAPATIVLAAVFERTKRYYGERAYRYISMEAGHIGENLHLQCVAMGLGTVMVGAFYDNDVKTVLGIDEHPLYVMPVGYPR